MNAAFDIDHGAAQALAIAHEQAADAPAREALLDAAFGPGRFRKTSEKLRRGRLPAHGLAFSAWEGGRLAGTVTARQERKTRTGRRMGIVMLSDPSGQYEALLFDEGLAKYRDLLEPGQSVILLVNADIREEGISIRVQSVQSLEAEAMRETRNLRIFLRDDQAVPSIQSLLTGSSAPPRGDGSVSVVVIDGAGDMEVEMQLRERLKLSQQYANAIKSVQGVVQVELV